MKNVSQPVRVTGILLLIVAVLVLVNVQMGRAQESDATAEPLPVVTVEPMPDEPVVTEREPVFTIPAWLVIASASAILSGVFVALAKEQSFKKRIEAIDKKTKDNAEMLYEGLSPRWQQTIDRVLDFANARVEEAAALVKLLKEMTDRKPNTEPQPAEPPQQS